MVADSGVAATTATSHLWDTAAEQAMALTFDGGVEATAAECGVAATAADGHRQRSVWWVFRANPTGTPRTLHYIGDCATAAV